MDTSAKQTLPKINYGLPILPFVDALYQILAGGLACAVNLAGIGFIVTGVITMVFTWLAKWKEWANIPLFIFAFLNVPLACVIGTTVGTAFAWQFYAVHSGLLLIIYAVKWFIQMDFSALPVRFRIMTLVHILGAFIGLNGYFLIDGWQKSVNTPSTFWSIAASFLLYLAFLMPSYGFFLIQTGTLGNRKSILILGYVVTGFIGVGLTVAYFIKFSMIDNFLPMLFAISLPVGYVGVWRLYKEIPRYAPLWLIVTAVLTPVVVLAFLMKLTMKIFFGGKNNGNGKKVVAKDENGDEHELEHFRDDLYKDENGDYWKYSDCDKSFYRD